PAHLTIPLVLTSLFAGAGSLPWWAAGLAAFPYGLMHITAPFAVAFTGLGAVAGALAGNGKGWKAVVASATGLGLAFLLRPDGANFIRVGVSCALAYSGKLKDGALPFTSTELVPL